MLLDPFCPFSTAKVLALKDTVLVLGGSTGESPTAPAGIGLRLPLAIPVASLTWEQGT